MNTGSALARFTITLSQAVTEPVQVEWFTSDGTAKAGVDYAANKGTVVFAPGETAKTVDILVYGRAVGTEDRAFFVEMLPPTNAILGASIGECIITVDTSGSTPVTAIIVPTGPVGPKGDPGEDGVSPDPAEIAIEVAPLIDVGATVLTAEGTETLGHPDQTTVKAVARRIAYASPAKLKTLTLADGDNLIDPALLPGVDVSANGFVPRVLHGNAMAEPEWSIDEDGKLLIKAATAGDVLYACQYDLTSSKNKFAKKTELEDLLQDLLEDFYSDADGKGDALVRVKQPLTGAVARTQHDKNAEFVSVDDFGAKGDGVTIDDAAFQAACLAARRVVMTPGKTYVLKNGFDMNTSNTILSGYGSRIKYIKPDANYYHAIRVGTPGQPITSGIKLEGFAIYCDDASMVRGDTGFAISVANAYNFCAHDLTISAIASAGVWVGTTDIIDIDNLVVQNNLADGIHITDGASNFKITNCFVRGCFDDAIAVVSDTPSDGILPLRGVVANNIVSDNKTGHAFVAIGCADVVWEGNLAKGCDGPGFGSYFWQTSGIPQDEDWVRNCTFSNNTVIDCGLNPVNVSNATSFFVGALKDCVISNNKISGAPGFPTAGTEANCLLIANALNVVIKDNLFHNSQRYGVYCRDGNTSAAATFSGIHILKNTFDLIKQDVVHLYPNASIGEVSVVDNVLINSPFDVTLGRSLFVGKTGSNKLTIAGNDALNTSLPFAYHAASVTNIVAYSNKPAMEITYPARLNGQGGTPSGTVTAKYVREGDMVFLSLIFNITAINGAANPTVSLPFPVKSGSTCNSQGRMDSQGGWMLNGLLDNSSTLRLIKYDNTGAFTGVSGAVSFSAHAIYLATP